MYPQVRKTTKRRGNGSGGSAAGQQAVSGKRKKKKPLWRKMVTLAVEGGTPRDEVLKRMTKDRHGNAVFSPPVDVKLLSSHMVELVSITVNAVRRNRRTPGSKARLQPQPKTAIIIQEGQRKEVLISEFFRSTKA